MRSVARAGYTLHPSPPPAAAHGVASTSSPTSFEDLMVAAYDGAARGWTWTT
jgi:hypothetical protein